MFPSSPPVSRNIFISSVPLNFQTKATKQQKKKNRKNKKQKKKTKNDQKKTRFFFNYLIKWDEPIFSPTFFKIITYQQVDPLLKVIVPQGDRLPRSRVFPSTPRR